LDRGRSCRCFLRGDDVGLRRRQALGRRLFRDGARLRLIACRVLRGAGAQTGGNTNGERKKGKTTHFISFLPPAPEVLTILKTWLTPAEVPYAGKTLIFRRFVAFLR